MFGIGMPELLVILAVALIVLGPKRLPDVAKTFGKAMGEFRRATAGISEELESARTMLEQEGRELEKATKSAVEPPAPKPPAEASAAARGEAPAPPEPRPAAAGEPPASPEPDEKPKDPEKS